MIRNLVVAPLVIVMGVLAADCGAGDGPKKAPYVHAVFFYLKKDAPKDAVTNLVADCHGVLAKVPSVKSLWAGRPAEKSTPKFAITDYQVGLLVLFENYEGLQTYLEHKLHLEFVEKHAKYFDSVPVYDFINQAK